MCLETVTYRNSKPLKSDERWAWKGLLEEAFGGYTGYFYGGPYRPGVWLKATGGSLYTNTAPETVYPAGFHCLATKRAAEKGFTPEQIVRVRIRKICAIGIDGGSKTFVAKEMYIPKPEGART